MERIVADGLERFTQLESREITLIHDKEGRRAELTHDTEQDEDVGKFTEFIRIRILYS